MQKPTLGNPQNTIEVLQKYGFSFQKKFGQNFLIDTHVLDKIIASAGITKDDMVLEIGPGIGTMTQYLACAARKVVAVEIDKALIPILEDTLSPWDNVTVINEDILKVNVEVPLEEIYNVTTEELRNEEVTKEVMESFGEEQAILRTLKKTSVDHVVGHISLVFELVYPVSIQIVQKQGCLDKLMEFPSDNLRTRKQFAELRDMMKDYINRRCNFF